jgi:hypothetical protein
LQRDEGNRSEKDDSRGVKKRRVKMKKREE